MGAGGCGPRGIRWVVVCQVLVFETLSHFLASADFLDCMHRNSFEDPEFCYLVLPDVLYRRPVNGTGWHCLLVNTLW